MKNASIKNISVAIVVTLGLAGCSAVDHDDEHAATKKGAMGGALLGLTLGALTGDAGLAMKGAVAGGVAGGVAGSAADLENSRESSRSSGRDDAIANIGNNNQQASTEKEDEWSELTNFMGDWNVSISGMNADKAVKATAQANGVLVKTTKAQVVINQVIVDGEIAEIKLTTQFSYDPIEGYSAVIKNETNNQELHFAGEFQPGLNRYNFYPISDDALFVAGTQTQDFHIQLGFAGKKIWMLDTYALVDGKETKIQSYRFSKKG